MFGSRAQLYSSAIRAGGLASQLGVVVVLGLALPKHEVGSALLAFAICRLTSLIVGQGLGHSVFLETAGDASHGHLSTLRQYTMIGLCIGIGLVALLTTMSAPIERLLDDADLGIWLIWLSPLALVGVINSIQTSYLEARGELPRAILWSEAAPGILRLAGLLLLAPFGYTVQAVAIVLWAPLLLGWVVVGLPMMLKTPEYHFAFPKELSRSLGYSAHTAASLQLQGVDVIVAGFLFSPQDVADYAVASRIAALFPFFSQLTVKAYAPVARILWSRSSIRELQKHTSYMFRQSYPLLCWTTSAGIVCTILLVKYIMTDYVNSLMIVSLLALPAVFRASFAPADRLLQITGHVRLSTSVMIVSFVMVAFLPFLLVDVIGVSAIPISMLVSAVALNPILAVAVFRQLTVRAYDLAGVAISSGAISLVLLALTLELEQQVLSWVAATAIAASGILFLFVHKLRNIHSEIYPG